jgi:predicted permease
VVRSLSSLLQTDLGFKTDSILTAEISPADAGPDDQRRIADSLFRPLQHQAAEIPGVQAAALTNSIPGQNHPSGSYIIDSQSMDKFTVSSPQAGFTVASTGYFQALGMHLLAGRDFAETDTLDAPPIAVISESLARSAFPGRDPVGHKIFCGLDEYTIKGQMTIVGVVNDAHMDGPAQPVTAELYVPATQHPRTAVTLLIKTTGAPERQIESVRRLVHGLNPSAAVRFNTVAALMSDVVASPRFTSILLSSFAAIALTLALIGVYAVMSYTVVQRSAEVGLRMALGAERAGVMRMILTQALRLAVVGGIIGLAGAFAATRLLRSLLFNVKPLDPVTYGLAILLLLISAVVASFWPAWRASRIDPMEALRQE